ncbi:hypothetical protein CRYUN_Cryun05aG0018100 [Craigia yunnanensis]
MHSHLLVGPIPINGGNSSISAFPFNGNWPHPFNHRRNSRKRWVPPPSSSFISAAGINGEQNHYSVLGVARNASSAISSELIGFSLERIQLWGYYTENDLVRKEEKKEERFQERYKVNDEYSSFYDETDDEAEKENLHQERSSSIEVLKSAFITLFLLQTFGSRFCLTFNSLMALLDDKLDMGYKIGYVIAWILGRRGGITNFMSLLCKLGLWENKQQCSCSGGCCHVGWLPSCKICSTSSRFPPHTFVHVDQSSS